MKLYKQLQSYTSNFLEEEHYKELILNFLDSNSKYFCRSNLSGHITASAFLLNHDCSSFLLMHHAKLNQWLQLGGHLETNEEPLAGAVREAQEESGILQISPIFEDIYDIDVHLIPENRTEPSHYHYDIRFLLKTGNDNLQQNNESKELRWIPINSYRNNQIEIASSIRRMIEKMSYNYL